MSFKQRQMETSQMTRARLMDDLNRKKKEMNELTNLNNAVISEASELRGNIGQMKAEVAQLEDVDGLRRVANTTIQQLTGHRKRYIKRRDAARGQCHQLQVKHDGLVREISGSDVWRELEEQVKKMRYYEQSIHQVKEYIEIRGRETDYKSVAADCIDLVNILNEGAKRSALESEKATQAQGFGMGTK